MTDQPKDQSRSEQAKAEQTKAEQAKSESGFQYSLSNLRPVTPPEKITLTFPDGARREYAKSITGLEIAKGISPSLAKRTVAMALDGVVSDLDDPIEADAKLELINRDDPRALELIRHDCAHVLAEAVQTLWPGTQVTIGPVIENGFYYDFFRNEPFTPEDFAAIEKKMRELIARDKPFTKEVWDREKTKQVFRDKGEAFKVELVDAIPGNEPIKIYYQGDWFDLCRGPHMTSTGKVGNAFKLMKVAGAYWRGDSNNPMLTRIYGTAFAKQEDLDAYLKQIEEAEKRDHRKLGRELDLFHFQEEGPGVVFWHAKGWTIFQQLIAYMRRRLSGDYSEVNAPQILDKSLWETSGHWGWYRENMFAAQSAGDEAEDKRWFALKPMNCPGHVQIFKHGLKSYRDLPLRLAEFGVVHRYEPSGAMHGLMRVRGFTQDDAHIFCMEDQLADECLKINELILSTYADFGFTGDLTVKLSTRPEKRVGTDAMWDHAERVMATVLREIQTQNNHIKTEIESGRRRLLRAEVRICAARRYRPRLAMRHHAGRLQPAGTVRCVLHRPRQRQEAAGDGAPRDLRFDGALHRHPDRALCRQLPALAVAGAGGGHHHHVGGRRIRQAGSGAGPACGTSGRDRPAQRKDQLQGPRAFAGQDSGTARGRQERGRDTVGLDPAARQRRPERDHDGGGARRPRRRGDPAGCEAGAWRGLIPEIDLNPLSVAGVHAYLGMARPTTSRRGYCSA
ncbi:threonyl-tRNA synthetase [Bradyrhizobium sp. LM3.2]